MQVMDLAEGHLSALRYMDESTSGSGYNKCSEFNLGTGAGCSVMDMLSAMGVSRASLLPSFYFYLSHLCVCMYVHMYANAESMWV
jgi:UDP-glucose 4-epimerase